LWDAVAKLAADGTTIVISSHDLVEASRCEVVGVFVEGEVIAQGTIEEVIERSAAHVLRVANAPTDLAAMQRALPELAFVRRGGRHHDLVFRGEIEEPSFAWLRSQNATAQTVEATLEDAMSIYVKPEPPRT
jgi:ABC-type multidrug transport system ATPase subunit